MSQRRTVVRASALQTRLAVCLSAALVPALVLIGKPSQAEEQFHQIKTIEIPGNPLVSFDISWVDPVLDIYILADRSNNSLDVINVDNNKVKFQVTGFVGPSTGSDHAGPDGVVTVHHREAWAGDGDSTVKVVDLKSRSIVDSISTGGTARADELAYDPRDEMILIANDADSPPFVTLISTESGHAVLKKIPFNNATNGLEQPVWVRDTGLFYLAVPEVNGNVGHGEVAVIDPKSLAVVNTFPVNCEPNGLAQGPYHHLLLGCNDGPLQVIDFRNGNSVATVGQTGHVDEVWFNPGDGHYFGASSSLGLLNVIDAYSNHFDQNVPTGVGSHSVAADPQRNHVFVPLRPVPTDPKCLNGCVAVFAAHPDDKIARNFFRRDHFGEHGSDH